MSCQGLALTSEEVRIYTQDGPQHANQAPRGFSRSSVHLVAPQLSV